MACAAVIVFTIAFRIPLIGSVWSLPITGRGAILGGIISGVGAAGVGETGDGREAAAGDGGGGTLSVNDKSTTF